MVSLVNSTKYVKRINPNSSQTFPNSFNITLIPKPDKDTRRKKENNLQANIPSKYAYKSSQQNTSKLNSTTR